MEKKLEQTLPVNSMLFPEKDTTKHLQQWSDSEGLGWVMYDRSIWLYNLSPGQWMLKGKQKTHTEFYLIDLTFNAMDNVILKLF